MRIGQRVGGEGVDFSAMEEQYLKTVREQSCGKNKVYIYGAGNCGKSLAIFLREHHVKVDGFCVTDSARNMSTLEGLSISGIHELGTQYAECLFLIGTKPGTGATDAIIDVLGKLGIEDFIVLPVGFFEKILSDDAFYRPLLQITPKLGCSINCHFCPQSVFIKAFTSKTRKTMMSLQEFKECLDKTPQNTIIEFAGFVEPFLNPEAAEMMLYVAETGREVSLFTTLVGMDERIWQKIKDISFRKVVLHLPDEKHYADIPMTEEYFSLLKQMVNHKKPDGSNFIDLVNSQAEIHTDVMKIIAGKVLIWSGDLIDRAGNLQAEGARSATVSEGPIYCKTAANVNHNILLPDGSLVLCCMDMGMQHVIGNLLQDSYEDIMQGEIIMSIRKQMSTKELKGLLCRTCTNAVPVERGDS